MEMCQFSTLLATENDVRKILLQRRITNPLYKTPDVIAPDHMLSTAKTDSAFLHLSKIVFANAV